MAALDFRSVQKGDSLSQGDWMMCLLEITISKHTKHRNSHSQQHSYRHKTASIVWSRIFYHQEVNDCLNIKERNPWQANNAHNYNNSESLLMQVSAFRKKCYYFFHWKDTNLNFYFAHLKFATGCMQPVNSNNNVKSYNLYSVSSYEHHKKILSSCTASHNFLKLIL